MIEELYFCYYGCEILKKVKENRKGNGIRRDELKGIWRLVYLFCVFKVQKVFKNFIVFREYRLFIFGVVMIYFFGEMVKY